MNTAREKPVNAINRQECPLPETLLAFYRNSVSKRERNKIKKHIANCAACLDESQIIRSTLAGEQHLISEIAQLVDIKSESSSTGIIRKQHRRLWLLAGSAAAAVSLLFVAILFLKNRESSFNDQVRGSIYEISTIEPQGEVPLSKWNGFRWRSIKGVDSYVISVYDEDLRIVWKSDKVRNEYLLPSVEITEIFKKGKSFSWQVIGNFSDGRAIKSKPVDIIVQ